MHRGSHPFHVQAWCGLLRAAKLLLMQAQRWSRRHVTSATRLGGDVMSNSNDLGGLAERAGAAALQQGGQHEGHRHH